MKHKLIKLYTYFILLCSIFWSTKLLALSISPQVAESIADKIWKNECSGKMDALTHWNQGENFGSFGIGHFIWYPTGVKERFHETFPELLQFIKDQGVELPEYLTVTKGAPWPTREVFYNQFNSPEMKAFRIFLYETKGLQAQFIAKRLEMVLPEITKNLNAEQKETVVERFSRLFIDSRGIYAVTDYLNFKGAGILASETYQGEGWGLLHVLLGMSDEGGAIDAFVASARTRLIRRVDNSPPERNEKRWLPGWLNRLESYKIQ